MTSARKSRTLFLLVLLLLVAACSSTPSVEPDREPEVEEATSEVESTLSMNVADYDHTLATRWFTFYLELTQETGGYTPPVASRAYGYATVAFYEALVPGMEGYNSLAGSLNGLTSVPQPEEGLTYHWPTAGNAAIAYITSRVFPNASLENMGKIKMLEEEIANEWKAQLDPEVFDRSIAFGTAVAEVIYQWCLTDGGRDGHRSNFPDYYEPPVGEGLWVATPPDFANALQPYWGDNRPLAMPDGDSCDPGPPPEYSEDPDSEFYAEAMEVVEAVRNGTEEQRRTALYWADDPRQTPTPPGHSLHILTQVLQQENASLDLAAEAYARMGISVADSFISIWHTKYKYNLIRPITYIRNVIDPSWNTPIINDPVITPPFPEYTSGHSGQTGAAMQILTEMFGEPYQITDRTHERLGVPARTYNSFNELAAETAISRLYGGIHFRAAIERGIDEGKCVAGYVMDLPFKDQ